MFSLSILCFNVLMRAVISSYLPAVEQQFLLYPVLSINVMSDIKMKECSETAGAFPQKFFDSHFHYSLYGNGSNFSTAFISPSLQKSDLFDCQVTLVAR